MRVTRQFPDDTWNHRRFSKPWISVVVVWPVGGRPEVRWGSWLGKEGQVGELEVEAEPGDIVKFGQKDYRNRNGTVSKWGVVKADGTILELAEQDARKFFGQSMDKLIEEIQEPTQDPQGGLGCVLEFKEGITEEEAYAALEKLRDVLVEFPDVRSYNPEYGGPVWYIP